MNTRKSSAVLALLMSFLIAIPPLVLADDTELFTTSANPNVLLMLDTTGSMSDTAGSSSVGDLDGQGGSNTRMDILWKVVYTLLNADLSVPASATTYTCKTSKKYNKNVTTSTIQVNGTNWSRFPSTNGTIQIGSGGQSETFTYSSKTINSSGNYLLNFSPSITFGVTHNNKSVVSISAASIYPYPYPGNNTEAMGTDFRNNLTTEDEDILRARMGLLTFTTDSTGSTVQINIRNQVSSNPTTSPNSPPFNPSYQNIWSSVKSYAYASGGTPTAQALHAAQGFFNTAYNSSQVCRQNYAVLITDGEDTKGGVSGAPTGNGFGPDYFCGGSFNPDGKSCGQTGQVARNNAVIQEAANLVPNAHGAQLFTVGVGISDSVPHMAVLREVLRRAAEQANTQADIAQYTAIGASGDNTARAAGKAFFATDASELSTSMRNIFQQITAGMYSFTAPTVASVRMTDRNYLYKASFTPAAPPATFWEGHLQALTINTDNTFSSLWDAGELLRSRTPSSRNIYLGYTDNVNWSRLDFDTTSITVPMLGVDNTAVRNSVVNYIRGVGHDNNSKLGDIFHSKPIVVGPPSRFYLDGGYSSAVGGSGVQSFADNMAQRKRVVYVGTNDGMLHAFLSGTYQTSTKQYDTGTGAELFGYIPFNLLDNLGEILPGDLTSHGYFTDSSPRVGDVWIDDGDGIKQSSEWRTVLIGGLRKGGNGYFALDVTNPDASGYPGVLWEYTDPTHVGQTWSEPFIGKVKVSNSTWPTATRTRDRWVAIFGGGTSDAGTVGASLVVLDIATGRALKTFTTGIDNVIPASPVAALDANGYIKFVYVADLDGSLYKFDFRTTGIDNSYSQWRFNKIFQASAGQPVYHRVESGSIDESNRYLFFGTGDQENPVSNPGTGKFYAIKDSDTDNTLHTESNLANLSTSITSLSGGTVGTTQFGWFINFASVPSTSNDSSTHSGEKVLSDPVVFFNNVFFTTFTPDVSNPCGGGGIARVYGLQMLNAGAGLASLTARGETANTKVPYHVYTGSEGGIPSSPSLSIYPSGQSSIFVGFSTGRIEEIKVESPPHMKTIKSWKETF
jgi:PilC-like protein with beta-propeller domain